MLNSDLFGVTKIIAQLTLVQEMLIHDYSAIVAHFAEEIQVLVGGLESAAGSFSLTTIIKHWTP